MSFRHHEIAQRVRAILDASTDVQVITEPGPEAPLESFLVDFEPSTFTMGQRMRPGTGALATEVVLRIGIEAHRPGHDVVDTQARWFEIANIAMNALRADRSLASGGPIAGVLGVTGDGEIRGPQTAQLSDGTGWACIGDLIVRVRTDIC